MRQDSGVSCQCTTMESNDENNTDGDNRKSHDHDKKKMNEDLVVFMRKRSDADLKRYTARLKSYVNVQQKKCRATAARRRHANHHHYHTDAAPGDIVRRDVNCERATSEDSTASRSRRNPAAEEKKPVRARSTDSRSVEPSDRRCGRRRRRRSRCRRRRRRRSRCRRRRRRSRCRRRRRRRSRCRRRRRRRSCRRRRRRC